ncbi:MAG: protein kinase [Ignavibacteria bacterium]|nr:protein kinase [Ignavibacteria bacterium]
MIGNTISHYKILEKLGEGGMGVVYKAHDSKLDRMVALKFLPHHVATNQEEEARFLQEARASAILNHPHVCTVFDIREEEGPASDGASSGRRQFIVMEFVNGTTLREKMSGSSLSVKDAITYGIQIGEALQEAHSNGIVHRDVKSENIMVNSKNQVKVMDFGLAKLKGSLRLTKESSTVGTLAYMAPEQIHGGDIDARSDIFSFGVLLFEMITGKLPFRGGHDAAIMYSILNEEPEPLPQNRDDLPGDLQRIIHRAIEKDPEDRYQHVDDMVSELRRLKKDSSRVSRPVPGATPAAAPRPEDDAIPATKSGTTKRWFLWGGIGLVIAVVGIAAYVFLSGEGTSSDSVAVLPLVNVNSDPETEYLSDGITEGVINSLSRISGLRVIPRSSVFFYKGKEMSLQKIASELNVRTVLTGKVLQRGDNLDIQVELVDVQKLSQLWGEKYSRPLSELISTQDQIVREIAEKLKVTLTGGERTELERSSTTDPEAYKLYLQGRYHWNKRTEEGMKKAVTIFEQAIEKDPTYALAYSGLADAYITLGDWGFLSAKNSYPRAKAAANAALKLDNTLAEAHTALAYISYAFDWDGTAADAGFRKAITLNPRYPTARQWYAEFLAPMGRYTEALAQIKTAQELDPLSLIINAVQGLIYIWGGEYDKAIDQCRRVIELDPDFFPAQLFLQWCYLYKGMNDEAARQEEILVRIRGLGEKEVEKVRAAYAASGLVGMYRLELERLKEQARQGDVNAEGFSDVFAALGDAERAFEWLEKSYQEGGYQVFLTGMKPWWRDLRTDPRLRAMLERTGLKKEQ